MSEPDTRSRSAITKERSNQLLQELHASTDETERRRLRDELVQLHLPLVEYLARRFKDRGEPLHDLVQVGTIGLIKSIDRFEPERGLEFSTYATPTILGEIKRYFRDSGWLIKVPRRAQELQTTLNSARSELSQKLGRAPTVTELAQHIEASEEEVLEALDAARAYSAAPLEVLTESGGGRSDHPLLATIDDGLDRVEQRAVLRPALDRLDPQEREVLMLRFVAGRTQTEIAALVGVSQMQVSRLVSRSLAKLRGELEVAAEEQSEGSA
ncbi:RNA polymerase, sigma 28 subunit, SigD/FliA/WhiG [Frankineae bacterium MT45]|nr:RNA polymerase, sigma 28 subunit, SigD/FliA/WhiG [Frankineae bacterium MT45]